MFLEKFLLDALLPSVIEVAMDWRYIFCACVCTKTHLVSFRDLHAVEPDVDHTYKLYL